MSMNFRIVHDQYRVLSREGVHLSESCANEVEKGLSGEGSFQQMCGDDAIEGKRWQ
jgi:hypothetical protein